MSDRLKRQQDPFETPVETSTANRDVGRSTLGDSLDGVAGTPSYSSDTLFARAANVDQEEDNDADPPLPQGDGPDVGGDVTQARAAAADSDEEEKDATAPEADAVQVTAGDDPEAKQRIYGDDNDNAHGKPFERKKKQAEDHKVAGGKYNQEDIKSDKIGKNVAARPGVVIKTKQGRDGVFMLKGKQATRYLYVKRGNDLVADPYDVIERSRLAPDNYKSRKRAKHENGNVLRLLLNPSEPRRLLINGKRVMCVLTFVDGMTSAWMPINEINGDRGKILRAVRSRAKRWQPGRVSKNPDKIAKASTRYVIRNDKVGQKTRADEGLRTAGDDNEDPRVLSAGSKGGNNVSHYLNKDIRKPGFDAAGNKVDKNITRSVVTICMNLPANREPPIAADTAEAGQSFFVMNTKSLHREVPVFENGKKKANRLQMWVFGHLAMRDAGGNLVPDPDRRGWVPLRVLAKADKLETKDVEQRIPGKDDDSSAA